MLNPKRLKRPLIKPKVKRRYSLKLALDSIDELSLIPSQDEIDELWK